MGCGRGYCRLAPGALRLTLGRSTTQADVDYVVEILTGILDKLRATNPVYSQNNRGAIRQTAPRCHGRRVPLTLDNRGKDHLAV
jgi:hypothetical protein